jgi:hypothetical protein
MEKHLIRWSYLLGLLCFGISLVWRVLNALNVGVPDAIAPGRAIWYSSFYKAGFLFLMVCIAAVNFAWYSKQSKSQA